MSTATAQAIDSHTCSDITAEYRKAEPLARMKQFGQTQHSLAPDFTLATVGGQSVHLRDLQGHPVVLFFFATWGRICRAQLTGLAELARSGVIVLGISTEDAETLARFSAEHDVPFPLLVDPEGLSKGQYEVSCLPTTICICSHGTVVACHRGDVDLGWSFASL